MESQIVSKTIELQQAGSYQHFEMRIPISTQKIVGVECGVTIKSSMDLIPTISNISTSPQIEEIGELRLHCANEYQWFYACNLTDYIRDSEKQDYYFNNTEMKKPYFYNRKHEADTCQIKPNTTRIKGFFKDIIGLKYGINLQYQITISIHLDT